MPTLNQLGNGSDPTLVNAVTSNPVVEPLDGPSTVDQVFDRFPEEVYQQGKDSHLYRFLTALGGDAGAGFIKTQAYTTRLQWEAEFLAFGVLDSLYASQFRFNRLANETYSGLNPQTDALTPDQWNQVEAADQSYRQRMAEFWTATRSGNTPDGLATMAQAGLGLECEVVENYKWVFDQMSDDPLGLQPMGTTNSVYEFVIVPRFLNSVVESNYEYTQTYPFAYIFNTALMPFIRPSLGGSSPTVTVSVTNASRSALKPEYERNMIDLLDRLKPTGTLGSVVVDDTRYIEIGVQPGVVGSSERIHVSRLVTGQRSVDWPITNPSKAHFIEGGVEKEAGYFYGSARELPIIFLTIENVHAYTEQALNDPSYATSSFFSGSPSPQDGYVSEHVGNYSVPMQALYPFLNGLSSDISYVAENAVATHDTPLMLEGRAV